MIFKHILKSSLTALKTHKSRSALTILGIVIGIASIILIMSLGKGAQELILGQIRGMGSQTISIDPGREPKGPSDFAEMFTDSLKAKDLHLIQKIPGVKDVSPFVVVSATVSFENNTKRSTILGSSDLLMSIFELTPKEGIFFDQEHVKQKSAVAVLGWSVKEKLFGNADALNQKIKIKNTSFRVIGVIGKKGQVAMMNIDEMVAIPYTTAQSYLLGIDHFHSMIVQAESEDIVDKLTQDIAWTLRESHGITDPEKDDFYITTQADAIERTGMIMGILTAFLSAIAAISLIVGGIGIMNIMLVSVTERTKEIGLRKAIGAKDQDILYQFLTESVILTLCGGIIGIMLGVAYSFIASLILSRVVAMGWVFTVSLQSIALGVGVSAFVGLVFGIYPARQASKKSPIEALRSE